MLQQKGPASATRISRRHPLRGVPEEAVSKASKLRVRDSIVLITAWTKTGRKRHSIVAVCQGPADMATHGGCFSVARANRFATEHMYRYGFSRIDRSFLDP